MLSQHERVVASAPASIAVAGDTTDVSGKGATLTLGIEGPDPAAVDGLRAYAMVTPTAKGATSIQIENTDEVTADTFYGTGRLLELAGYGTRPGFNIAMKTTIPPKLGLGGAASQFVALLCALDAFAGRKRPPEELAEIAQRATLRPGQVHGYQKAYGATFGGVHYLSFSHKLTGLWARGEGGVYDEPYAAVSEARDEQWSSLDAAMVIAVPKDLNLVSGEINALIAGRYRDSDPSTMEAMDRKTFITQMAHQRLVNKERESFWALVESDTTLMDAWGLIGQEHKRIMRAAHEHGAYAAKPASTGGAVIVFCPTERQEEMADALGPISERVLRARVARGVRLEDGWPFAE